MKKPLISWKEWLELRKRRKQKEDERKCEKVNVLVGE